jgi:hypothetical protein
MKHDSAISTERPITGPRDRGDRGKKSSQTTQIDVFSRGKIQLDADFDIIFSKFDQKYPDF